jgi:hypothetical protein
MAKKTKAQLQRALLDAEERCGRWLADGNEHREAGRKFKADQCYEKSQFWLDRANKIKDQLLSI